MNAAEEWASEPISKRLAFVLAEIEMPPPVQLSSEVRFVSMLDPEYPTALFALSQPPLGLFVRGELGNNRRIGVVGSRIPSPYSLRLAYRCTKLWAQRGWIVVSGGAIGIDSEAHRAALDENSSTWAVFGNGFEKPHPRRNQMMFESILEKGGAWISEYPPWFEPRAYYFPERNRLIAALSDVLFIAQAHERSGSLSTARTALDLGREIMVLRPPPGDASFAGSQILIDAGARSLKGPEDLEVYLAG